MKNFFFAFLLLNGISLFSQTEKGASPLSPAHALTRSPAATRAVVIGISDYQEKDIPDLRFADKDAEAFANYLRSPAGGGLDNDHLQILTNQNATAGRVAEALDALVERTKEGDQVIIYFSGHGDVERKTISQPGFLLCWDSPARVYMGGGTYSLAFLQEIVSTLSVQNKAKVLVVTDACHAGKLAGSQIGGSQATAANLAKQFANEVKILSCQPNEFSLEGEQWGGGRGIFSYHLVDGLFGLADRNGDGSVSVGEIDRYLEDKVTAEAAPQSQVPMLLGNKTERLATVHAAVLADLQKHKSGAMTVFMPTEQRGFEEEVLAGVDSSIRELYRAFKLAVKEKRFFAQPENVGRVQDPSDVGPAADEFYEQLTKIEALAPLRGAMKRNYAAALQDDAQQVMNKWLKTDVRELVLTKISQAEKYKAYPNYLKRASELLGSQHYMMPVLQARKSFFEGYLLYLNLLDKDTLTGLKVLEKFKSALKWQSNLPQAYYIMSKVFWVNLLQPDSAVYYAGLAASLAPSWVLPLTDIAVMYSYQYHEIEQARSYLEKATQIDSGSLIVLVTWGDFYYYQKRYAEAEVYYKQCLDMNPAFVWALNHLGVVYAENKRHAEAELLYKKVIALDTTYMAAYYNISCMQSIQNQVDNAYLFLRKALDIGFKDFNYLQQDPDLAPLREQKEQWKELMKKHFPDKVKD